MVLTLVLIITGVVSIWMKIDQMSQSATVTEAPVATLPAVEQTASDRKPKAVVGAIEKASMPDETVSITDTQALQNAADEHQPQMLEASAEHSETVVPEEEPAKQKLTVTASIGNVRSNPDSSADVVVRLESGAIVTVVAEQGEWYQIRTRSGLAGWAHNSLFSSQR